MIGIIGAMEEEIKILKSQLQELEVTSVAGIDFYSGMLGSQKVVLALSGIGKVNGAVCTALLINQFKCCKIINTGSAAGLARGIGFGDVVISTGAIHFDANAVDFGYELGQVPQMPLEYLSDDGLRKLAHGCVEQTINDKVTEGLIVSGDTFVTNTTSIKKNFPSACALDMESAGIAQACYKFDIPFIIIRAISDTGDSDAYKTHDEFLVIASKNSAEHVIALVNSISD